MRPRVSCPDCGVPLIEVPDFFGAPRLKHPDIECVKVTQRTPDLPEFTTSRCIACRGWFAQRTKGYRRATCSYECFRVVRRQNLLAGRLLHQKPPRPKTSDRTYKYAERYRRKWQKRADELDRRWGVVGRKGGQEPRSTPEHTPASVAA